MSPAYKLDAEKVRQMRLEGRSMQEIADAFGATRAAVSKLLRHLDGPLPHAIIEDRGDSVSVTSDVPTALVAAHIASALRRAGWHVEQPD